jgi:hypothetical protein
MVPHSLSAAVGLSERSSASGGVSSRFIGWSLKIGAGACGVSCAKAIS